MSEEETGDDRISSRLDAISGSLERLQADQRKLSEGAAAREKQSAAQAEEARIAAYGNRLAQEISTGERGVEEAERRLTTAYEEGDSATIAKNQRALSEAVSGRDDAKRRLAEHRTAKAEYEARRKRAAEREQQEAARPKKDVDDGNLNDWQKRNSWYGVDAEMTKAAQEIDAQIRDAGVIAVGSKPYFEAIDRQMAAKFPQQHRSPDTASGGRAPSHGGGGGGGGGRIPAHVLDGWRRMGIDVDDPKEIEAMVGHRQTAVNKGLLPEQPVYERVR